MTNRCGLACVPLLLGCLSLLGCEEFNRSPISSTREPAVSSPAVPDSLDLVRRYQQTITPRELAAHVHLLASDLMQGREAATIGQKLAALYLGAQYLKMNLSPAVGTGEGAAGPTRFFQPFTWNAAADGETPQPLLTENVVALIEGIDPALKHEAIVITSHYDHLGVQSDLEGDTIFNGAADDASGTAASLELAEAFMQARADGHGPRRSILFLNTSAEEKGTRGSAHYTDVAPIIPLRDTVANINMDGIAGFDPKQAGSSSNYIYIIGSDLLSAGLRDINKQMNEVTGIGLDLDYTKDFNSDHRNFEKHLVPYLYYSTGLTEHYHRPSDEPDTIDYEHMARVTRLVFATVWQVANEEERVAGVSTEQRPHIGFICPPCPVDPHDDTIHDEAGGCPSCGMTLVPIDRRRLGVGS